MVTVDETVAVVCGSDIHFVSFCVAWLLLGDGFALVVDFIFDGMVVPYDLFCVVTFVDRVDEALHDDALAGVIFGWRG